MLRERYPVDKLFDEIAAHFPKMDPILAKVDGYLEDEELYQFIKGDLSKRCPKTLETGRKSTPVEVALRMMVVKRLQYSYAETERYVSDSLVLRQFCRVYLNRVPDDTTLIQLANLVQHVLIQGAGYSVGGVPEVSVAELPFLYKNYAHAAKAIPQVVVPYMNSKMIPKGVRLLEGAYAYTAYRGVLSRTKPIKTFDDIKGVKIRVPQNPVYVNTFKAAGANPTVINFGELYTALQSGVVEACELTPELIIGAKSRKPRSTSASRIISWPRSSWESTKSPGKRPPSTSPSC